MSGASSLNIALLLESDGPGGAEWMLLHLATELRRRGHFVLPVGPADGSGWLAAEFRKRGFQPATFQLRRPLDPACALDLRHTLRSHQIDIVHSHEFTMAFYGAAAASMIRRPHIITMHGGMHYADRLRRRIAIRWAFRRSSAVVAVSAATRDRICEALGVKAKGIDVIWNGVPAPATANGARVRVELALDDDAVLALAVGNLYPVKGHVHLIDALARIRTAHPGLPLHVAIAGRGDERAALQARIREHGLEDRVRLLGFRDDVPELLDAADIYVMPSLSEGLPLALAEAMLAGKAVVASRVGGIPEIVEDGSDGRLVEPGEPEPLAAALLELATDPELRTELGSRARAMALRSLTTSHMTDRYIELYCAARNGRST